MVFRSRRTDNIMLLKFVRVSSDVSRDSVLEKESQTAILSVPNVIRYKCVRESEEELEEILGEYR